VSIFPNGLVEMARQNGLAVNYQLAIDDFVPHKDIPAERKVRGEVRHTPPSDEGEFLRNADTVSHT
jgi:hypothetical protein